MVNAVAVLVLPAMRTRDFFFDLPDSLIAQTPPGNRRDSRLLLLDSHGTVTDRQFSELAQLLEPDDLLVLNDTRVIPARLLGAKHSGGQVEVLIERIENQSEALAHIRASKACKPGNRLTMEGELEFEVLGREGDLFRIKLLGESDLLTELERVGRIPLPPYIKRTANDTDRQRYQTVYAREPGAVAAPTAGLHFDDAMLDKIQRQGTRLGWLTLHVGAGTFQPVRSDSIEQHAMHRERLTIGTELAQQIADTRRRRGRIIAVGTTVVRALESVANENRLVSAYSGETDIFILPGYDFKVVDAIITNFHLPESTLLMLVSAFAGIENIMAAYKHAVQQGYRFFSYGDAMFIERPVAQA